MNEEGTDLPTDADNTRPVATHKTTNHFGPGRFISGASYQYLRWHPRTQKLRTPIDCIWPNPEVELCMLSGCLSASLMSLATGLVISLLLVSCQSVDPHEQGSLTRLNDEQRQEFFRACYIETIRRYVNNNLYVARTRVHQVCSKMARSRVPPQP